MRARTFAVIAALFLMGCNVPATGAPTPTPRRESTSRGEEPWCVWFADVEAWLDENESGVWDAGERPIGGLTAVAASSRSRFTATTSGNGRAKIGGGPISCPTPLMTVSGTPPPGYRLTTEAILPNHNGAAVYRFGVIPLASSSATATRERPAIHTSRP